jgi:PhnB protein
MRFGSVPDMPGSPPIPEKDKNMVIHVELRILGSHSLMGTDAPESGFKLTTGNNVHINLQPDTRKETKELFDKLSAGGNVTMELPGCSGAIIFWKLCE